MAWKLAFYCQTLLNNFVAKTQTFQTFTLFYLTLLVYFHFWFLFKIPKAKREESGSPSKNELQKPQRLYTQGTAAYRSVSKLVKASILPESKVRQFLHSKPSKKVILGTRKISCYVSILYSKHVREYKKPKFKIGDRDGILSMTDPSGGV